MFQLIQDNMAISIIVTVVVVGYIIYRFRQPLGNALAGTTPAPAANGTTTGGTAAPAPGPVQQAASTLENALANVINWFESNPLVKELKIGPEEIHQTVLLNFLIQIRGYLADGPDTPERKEALDACDNQIAPLLIRGDNPADVPPPATVAKTRQQLA